MELTAVTGPFSWVGITFFLGDCFNWMVLLFIGIDVTVLLNEEADDDMDICEDDAVGRIAKDGPASGTNANA